MKHNFDLHCHTNASDGSLSPAELVQKAAEEGITTIAITDHDTVSGVREALAAGAKYGVRVIPGVEISIDFQPGTMHVCGYFIDIDNPELCRGLEFVQEARRNRNPQIIQKLNTLGLAITMEEVQAVAGPDQVGRPHFAKVLLQKGYVENAKEAFTKYLAKGMPGYVDKRRLPRDEAIRMIQTAGGVAVMAHPIQLALENWEAYRQLFLELKAAGLAGIEAFNSYQSEEENQKFYQLAQELDMIVTAGSDFHGETKPTVQLGEFGDVVPIEIEKLLAELQRERRR